MGGSDLSANWHFVPNPLNLFHFHYIYFHFQLGSNFLRILTSFSNFLGPQGHQIYLKILIN